MYYYTCNALLHHKHYIKKAMANHDITKNNHVGI